VASQASGETNATHTGDRFEGSNDLQTTAWRTTAVDLSSLPMHSLPPVCSR